MAVNQDNTKEWLTFLNPKNLKGNMILSSVFIATYEAFKEYLFDNTQSLFITGIDSSGAILSDEYKIKVLSHDKDKLKSTLMWFKENDAISEDDIKIFQELRLFRNDVAHRLINLLFENLHETLQINYNRLLNLRIKIEKWWILNIEVPTNPDYGNIDITEDDITTSGQLMARLMEDILSDDESRANYYREEFIKRTQK